MELFRSTSIEDTGFHAHNDAIAFCQINRGGDDLFDHQPSPVP